MIFTAGRTAYYQKQFQEKIKTNQILMKAGRDQHKVGGSVWQTMAEAQNYCNNRKGMSVFGVLANWETDTAPTLCDEGWGWRDLLKSAPLVELSVNPSFIPDWISDPWNREDIQKELGIELTQSGLYIVDSDSVLIVPTEKFRPDAVWNRESGDFLCYVYKGRIPTGAFHVLASTPVREVGLT